MPWTVADARQKNTTIKSDTEAQMWVGVANKTLKAERAKGVPGKEAEARAVRAANAAVLEMHRKGGPPQREGLTPEPELADLREFVSSRGVKVAVDRARGMIEGVKILGLRSRNGREYLPQAVEKAAGLYEGIQVNVDHGDTGKARSYRDRLGKLSRVEMRPDGLYGNLHVNPKHALAEQLFWDAENAPENVGLSHDAQGRSARRGGKTVVEDIHAVRSVDLVADPASTLSLFESEQSTETPTEEGETMSVAELTLDALKQERPDLIEALNSEAAGTAELETAKAEAKRLAEELEEAKAAVAKQEHQAAVAAELKEAKLDATDETVCSPIFLEGLHAETDAEKRKAMIADRQKLVESIQKAGWPRSQSSYSDAGQIPERTPEQTANAWRE